MFKKHRISKLFDDTFGFEKNIDISDDCAVLYRRNIVIKNIIFLSNLIYSFILTVLSFGESSNWVLTIISYPVTFLVNNTLKKMIHTNSKELFRQQIAMYISCFYMFLSAILIYFRLQTGSQTLSDGTVKAVFSETGYILIYYALVVVSLYQDPKMLKQVSKWVVAIVTVLHFTLTYDILGADYASSDLKTFIVKFFSSQEFKDILLRTVFLVLYLVVLYAIVSIGQYMQEERKKELLKRKKVQDDFTNVVRDMFDVTLKGNQISDDEKSQVELLSNMSNRLSSIIGYSPQKCMEISDYSQVHLTKQVDLDLSTIEDKDMQFEKLREQTNLGNIIIKRLELRRKCEDIIRAHEEGWNTQAFMEKTKSIQNDKSSQIILICDMYISLRSPRNYKRPWSHSKTMELLSSVYSYYFDNEIFDRFIKFASDFEDLYNNY